MDARGAVMLGETVARTELELAASGAITLEEAVDNVMAMLRREDRNWGSAVGPEDECGFTLSEIKEWSKKIRESTIGAPWIKKGLSARSSYIWKDGIHYDSIESEGRGKGTNVQALIDDPINQRNFFGDSAHRRREGCLYHDAIAAWIGQMEQGKKRLYPLPLKEITDQLRDPDRPDVIWAYRHSWTHRDPSTGAETEKAEWIFTDEFVDKRSKIRNVMSKVSGVQEKVATDKVIFDMHANRQEGHRFGSPDALAAYVWNKITRDATMDGVTMQAAMASFAWKASTSSKNSADNASMRFARGNAPGATAVVGGPNDLTPMANAGKGYDFGTLRGLTAIIATSLDISNIVLTADVSAAGSSYGSASTLDLPTRLAMEARRAEHIELDIRVLKWLGAKAPHAYFQTLADATEIFRECQAILLLWSSGLYEPGPLEKRLSALLQVVENTVPKNVLLPNNSDSWQRLDIDPNVTGKGGSDSGDQTSGVGKPNATPSGQGQKSAAGKGQNANDLRKDGVGEMMARLEKFGEMIESMKNERRG